MHGITSRHEVALELFSLQMKCYLFRSGERIVKGESHLESCPRAFQGVMDSGNVHTWRTETVTLRGLG